MDPKKIIAIFVVAAVVAVAVGFGSMWLLSEKDPDGRFNFSGETADSYMNFYKQEIKPVNEKWHYYVVDVVLKNDNYDNGIDPCKLIWKATIDKGTYTMIFDPLEIIGVDLEVMHYNFTTMTFEKGKLWGYTIVFLVPRAMPDFNDSDVSLHYTYLSTENEPSLKYDANLKLPEPKMLIPEIAIASRY